jgi:hypothetical protein
MRRLVLKFEEWYEQASRDQNRDPNDLIPPAMNAQDGLSILQEEILGQDWCVVMPCNQEQVNAYCIAEILDKFSRITKEKEK